jgi:hypothetical protein
MRTEMDMSYFISQLDNVIVLIVGECILLRMYYKIKTITLRPFNVHRRYSIYSSR